NSNGSFSYVPAANYNGSDSFTYKANDGQADSGIATVSITITGVNDAPLALDDSYTTAEDTTLNVGAPGALANVSDMAGDTLTAIPARHPYTALFPSNSNGSFSYVPAANYNGSDSFTYKANDGLADSGIATVSITITGEANVPPTITITSPADGTLFISPADIKIVANATDLDGTISQVEFYQGTNLLDTTSVEIALTL